MTSDAQETRLGDHVGLQRGTTYKSALLDEPGPHLLGLASIERNGGFRRDKLRTYGGASPDKLLLRPGDLYVSLKDVTQAGDLLGAVARVPDDIQVGRLTQDTVKLEIDARAVSAEYLYWLLRTPQYRDYCRAHSMGTTNLSLSRGDFLTFAVPPLTPSRQLLLRALELLEQKVDSNRRLAGLLEQTAAALFRARFVDFVGVEEFEESEVGRLPRGWNVARIDELAELNARSHTTRAHPDQIRYIDISSVGSREIREITTLAFVDAPSRARRIVRAGDTIVSTVRPERRAMAFVHQAEPALTASTGFAVVSPETAAATYLYRLVTSDACVDHLAAAATGSAYPAVNPSILAAWKVPVPPDRGQEYEEISRPLEAFRHALGAESDVLVSIRDLLLPKLISGEVRVLDTHDAAEVIGLVADELDAPA